MAGALSGVTKAHASQLRARSGEQPPRLRWLVPVVLMGCCLAPSIALADGDNRITVLDLESDDVHDSFAGDLTASLRGALGSRPGFILHDSHASLLQLSLAHNCDPSEAACLGVLARDLELDGFIFGKVTHEGGAPVAILRRFDLRSGSVERSALVTFTSREIKSDELDRGAEHLLDELLRTPDVKATPKPQPHLELSPPTAAATTRANPAHSAHHAPREAVVEDTGGGSATTTLAYALLAGSLLSAGMTAVSFIEVYNAEHNANFMRYRFAVGDSSPNAKNVCSEADAGRSYGLDASSFRDARSSCKTGSTFEILQFVFLGGAIVAGGLGAFLLATDSSEEKPVAGAQQAALSVQPSVGLHNLSVDAQLTF
jgi:hypothetical protein